jgi:cobalt-zinc-cadmium efflux system outer membrane protein
MHRIALAAASAAIMLVAPPPVEAQRPVTRAEAVAAALAHGPRLSLAAADTSAARAAVIGARAFYNPNLSASLTKDAPQRHVLAELPVDFPWLRRARIASASAAHDASLDRFALERAAVIFDADTAYTNAIVSDARARLSSRNARAADSLLAMAHTRRDAGDAGDLDVELANVFAGQQRNQALADSLAALSSLLDLQAVMGDSTSAVTIALADTLALTTGGVANASGTPLAVAAAESSVRAADAAARAEKRSVWGSAAVQFGFDQHDPAQTGLLPVIGISIPIPLLNQNQGGIAAAQAERDRANAELSLIRIESARDIARLSRTREIAVARVAQDTALLASAQRVAAMSLTAYREGAATLASVLEAQRNARDTLGQYIDDVGAANAAAAALRLLTASAPRHP